MAAANKNVVFDVVGTLVGYEKLFEAIDARLGDRLRAQGVKPILLGYTWIEVAEREYTYLSMSGKYVSYAEVFEKIFWRMLWYVVPSICTDQELTMHRKAGIEQARDFAGSEDLAYIMEHGYKQLTLRPGAKECIEKLRNAGFTVRAFTMGDLKRVGAYFASAGVEMPSEHLQSCDTSEVGKPDPVAYKPLLERLTQEGGTPWFAAAHMCKSITRIDDRRVN